MLKGAPLPSAAAIRRQIEAALETRIPSALTPRPRTMREQSPTGIGEIDALLQGGLPIGAITELVGGACSGRTTLAQAALAAITSAGKAVAWVDASDTLDPQSAAAAGVDLSRQLWVRCGGGSSSKHASSSPAADTALSASGSGAALLMKGSQAPAPSGGCGSPHPRSEARGLDSAVSAIFHPRNTAAIPAARGGEGRNPNPDRPNLRRQKWIGTPGAPNRKLTDAAQPRCAPDREEQVATDRLPPRRGSNFKLPQRGPKNLSAAQIAYTGMVAGAWNDNRNNAAGRGLKTSPNAIAAGLPRFREAEARAAAAQAQTSTRKLPEWKPQLPTPELQARGARQTSQPAKASLAGDPPPQSGRGSSPLWKALDQALRATDLLLAGGGFSAIVLDLGSTPPEFAWRIPLATWFRFRAGAERSRTVLIVITQHPCTRSSAELVLRLEPAHLQTAGAVFTGARFAVSVDRQRFEQTSPDTVQPPFTPSEAGKLHLVPRKPPQRERTAVWHRETAWAGASR